MLSHTLEINIKVLPSQEGISGCENSFKGYRCNASLAFFYCTGLINYLDDRLISASALEDNHREGDNWQSCGGRITQLSGYRSTLFVTGVENRDSRSVELVKGYPRNMKEGRLENRISTVYCWRPPLIFKRFFDRFLTPFNVAHLAIGKRQSRERFNNSSFLHPKRVLVMCCQFEVHKVEQCTKVLETTWTKQIKEGVPVTGDILIEERFEDVIRRVKRGLLLLNFPNTSIKQCLTVQAMSTLTTCDLEILTISIVAWVGDHQSLNTQGRSPFRRRDTEG